MSTPTRFICPACCARTTAGHAATTANMVADRNARAMSVIAMNSKGHS